MVPPITIPEHSTLGDTFSNGYHAALVKQHPDGTIESMRMENLTQNDKPVATQSYRGKQELQRESKTNQKSITRLPKQPIQIYQPPEEIPTISSERFHSFIYNDGKEKNTVQIHLPHEER